MKNKSPHPLDVWEAMKPEPNVERFWTEINKLAKELRFFKEQEGRKHCRCCPAHPEYEDMDHSAYQ